MKAFLLSVPIIAFVVLSIYATVMAVHFNQKCGGRLERAAHANTVPIAESELSEAIAYLESNGLTDGYTSVFYRTPDEDIGFWFRNLKASLADLQALPADSTALEQSNMLMKLRETLMVSGEKGDHLRAPDGIAIYPNNAGWTFAFIVSLFASLICGFFLVEEYA